MAASASTAAAGGVVWRGLHRSVEVALVHRPRYDDWTLPKGKLEPGESAIAAAVREVGEELGATVAVSRRLVRANYTVAGTPKTVAYWAMRFVNGGFVANDEVDEVLWQSPAKARKLLSHDSERAVLADFAALPVPDAVVVLVRHARAGKRRDWKDDDDLRPLDETGTDQSLHLAQTLRHFRPEQIISAEPTRCIQTMQPLAALLGVPVQIDPVFGDASFSRSRSATQTALMSLAKPGRVVVVCSQGLTIPSIIERLSPGVGHSETRKGACWVLSIVDGEVVSADYYDPAVGAVGGRR